MPKISEDLITTEDKTVQNIINLLDEKYQQTKSKKFEVLAQQFQEFKLSTEESAEASWDKFCSLRSSLMKEKIGENVYLFLHTMFFNTCAKSKKIQRIEEHSFT